MTTLRNEHLQVSVDAGGLVSISRPGEARPFVDRARLAGLGGKITREMDECIRVTYPGGGADSITLEPGSRFVVFQTTLSNPGPESKLVNKIQTLHLPLDLGLAPGELRALGTGGLHPPANSSGSYLWMAVADPKSRRGVVGGWISSERGSGVVLPGVSGDRVQLTAQIDYGRLLLPAGEAEPLEKFAIGCFDDARLGLEAWADLIARTQDIHLPPQPVGYCTWYHARASDEKKLAAQSAFAAENLKPFGFNFIQIDDGWQLGDSQKQGPNKDFSGFKPGGPYPGGMKATADTIKRHGFTPGLWLMPFAGTWNDPAFADRQHWFARREDGKPFDVRWGGTALDLSRPEVRQHVRSVIDRIVHQWGYDYLKLDGLWMASATELMYVNADYKDDQIGNARFADEKFTNVQALREGLKTVRDAAGKQTFLLGCNGPQNMRSYGAAMGIVDAMRVGPDNGASWEHLLAGPRFGSRHYFLHGRVWYNDPDPLYVRKKLPLDQARLLCAWITITGQLSVSSDAFADLPADRLDLLRRTMPSHHLTARPVDLFENEMPRIWVVGSGDRKVIGLFNWDDQEWNVDEPLERFGVDPKVKYDGFDYWKDTPLTVDQGRLRLRMAARSSAVIALRPAAAHPQVISTNRHITQGLIDLKDESWNPATQTLSGESNLAAGDPYELCIAAESMAVDCRVEGQATIESAHEPGMTRVTIRSQSSGPVRWSIRFAPKP